jgi:ubiquitin carboxyl-terminal hydrolase 25/28
MLLDVVLPQLKREEPLITEDLRELFIIERSKGRWVPSEYDEALNVLQLDEGSPLLLDIYEADAGFLESAYKQQLLETWKPTIVVSNDWSEDVKRGMEPNERRQQLREAVRIAAEGTGREELFQVFKKISEAWSTMDPDRAYAALSVPKDTTDDMLLTVFSLRVNLWLVLGLLLNRNGT